MMQRIIIITIVLLAFVNTNAKAQLLFPAKWEVNLSKKNPKVGEEIDIVFRVYIDQGWYLYSTDFDPDLGPKVTEFSFEPHASYKTVGKIRPIGSKKKHSELWGGEYTCFFNKAEFRQKIKIKSLPIYIEGAYEYQVCEDEKCIFFEDDFEITN